MSSNITAEISPSSFLQFFNHEVQHGRRLTIIQRSSILTLHMLNFSVIQITQLTGCAASTVRRWITHYQHHHNLQDEDRVGRPRITTAETDTLLVAAATEEPFSTPRRIRSATGTRVSVRTVRRRLNDAGIFGRVARIEYPFEDEHIAKRLAFAQQHRNWDQDKWGRVLFGDESYICLGAQGRIWVQRPQDAAFQSQFMVSSQTVFASKIGIWACFSRQGVGEMRIFDDTMNTSLYTNTMRQLMKPCALSVWPRGEWFYLHDNSSYHGSVRSHEWFHNNGVTKIELPPYSPDLNPIENLWGDLKRRVELHMVHNIAELKEVVNEEWRKTSQLFCANLVHSMPRRMQAVIAAQGHKTPY